MPVEKVEHAVGRNLRDVLSRIYFDGALPNDSATTSDAADESDGLLVITPWRWNAAAPKESLLCMIDSTCSG